MTPSVLVELGVIRRAIADYMQSEGCSCCQDVDGHREHKAALGKLLLVEPYSDGSGHDFNRYATKPTPMREQRARRRKRRRGP